MASNVNTVAALGAAMQAAAEACAGAGLIRATETKPVIDTIATKSGEAETLLRGCVLKFAKDGGAPTYRIVPAAGEVLTTTASPKLGRPW